MFSFLHPCVVLRIETCQNKPFKYFYRDAWNEYALTESKAFPMFTNGPHRFYACLLVYLAFLHLVLEPLMKRRAKPFNYRPLLLVFNSFMFTINFMGFLIISCFVTDFGYSLWTCTWHVESGYRDLCLKLGYIFILAKIFELLKPVLSIMRGFKPHKIDTFNQVIFLMLAYKAFLFYPFGQHIWVIIVDTGYYTLVYMYLIFSCIGVKEMKPTKYKNYLPLLNMFRYSLMFAQSVVTFPEYCPGYHYLKIVSSTYSLLGFIFATIYMVNHLDREAENRKKQQQLKAE